MKQHAGHFIIKCAAISSRRVKYLDTWACLEDLDGQNMRKFQVTANIDKQTMPLQMSSAHNDHVHRSWPKSLAKRVLDLTPRHLQESTLQSLVEKFRLSNANKPTLGIMQSMIEDCSGVHNSPISRVTIHPLWWRILPKAMHKVHPPSCVEDVPRIAWNNGVPNLVVRLDKMNRPKLRRSIEGKVEGE